MQLTPDMAALFPSPGTWDRPYSWSLFEIGPQPESALIAIGAVEREGGQTRRLDVLVLDVGQRERHSRQVMIGQANRSHQGVKITPGDVIVRHERLRGRGIGTLVYNVVTAWAQRTFPDLGVDPITLVRPAGGDEFDRLARFYGRFGFEWDRPTGDWNREFRSRPMRVADLRQHPEEKLTNVRRVELPQAVTLMLERLAEADDDRRGLCALRASLTDRRDRWRTIGYRLDKAGWVVAFLLGVGAAELWSTL